MGRLPAGPGVVAVSGGADSVALLRACVFASAAITAAHVNHQLRGAESDGDEEFVRELCAKLGVPFRSTRIEVSGGNLEATARRLRYKWLSELGAAWIATGHTANDQAETVLHRMMRGTGLQGLRGIHRAGGVSPPCRGEHGRLTPPARLVRPLLKVSRQEVLDYLHALNQPYRRDSSNADPRFTRNRIRAEVLPLLASFNPEIVSVLGSLAEQAEEAHAFLEQYARELLLRAEKPRAGSTIILERTSLEAAPPLLIRSAMRLIWEREGWPMGGMNHDHWTAAATLADRDFPGGVTLRSTPQVIQLRRLNS
ncbi:MAG: tRNA lysidine(34) synthetase TilS [Gemmataceae bacterium]